MSQSSSLATTPKKKKEDAGLGLGYKAYQPL